MSSISKKPVIFVAFANDQEDRVQYLRNLPEEARQIREPMHRAVRDGLCEYVERANATADDIFRVFQDPEYRDRIAVFHYGGHANGYQLLLESSDGQPAAADAGGLAEFLGQQNGLQFVFLNGCSTQRQVEGLLKNNVGSVIATSSLIDDKVAMNFAMHFYRGLAGGANIGNAYNEAEAIVQTEKGGNSRALYYGDKDGRRDSSADTDRWPWELYLKPGAESVTDWSLPLAVGDPLFGLPPLPLQDLPSSPFRHLNWFDTQHADVFFGRGHQVRALHDLLTKPDSSPIVLLYGQSGVGKSSVLAAGLIPRLAESCEICYVRRNHELGLLGTVKQFLKQTSVDEMMNFSQSLHIDEDWRDAEEESSKPLIVIVDQLEECFTRPNPNQPQELDEFLNEIQSILGQRDGRPKGRLILGFRKEWLAEIESRLQDRKLPRAKVFLERLGRLGIIEAILGPTKSTRLQDQYQLEVEEGLASVIADDLLEDQDSSIAPTLQILLTKMWDRAIESNHSHPRFDQDLYWGLKRDGILLGDFLDQQLEKLRQWRADVVDSGLVLDLLSLHTTPLGTAEQHGPDELPKSYPHRADVLKPLLQRCKDLYLLVDPSEDRKSDNSGTRLSHDTLAPLVRQRFEDSDKPGQRARRILENRVVEWEDEQQGTPLDIQDLRIVERGRGGTRALNSVEQRLYEASRTERGKRIRTQNMLKILGGTAVLAITVLAVLAAISWNRAANEESRKAELLYVAHMKMIQQAWDSGNPQRARDLLDRHVPTIGKNDLRTIEWDYYDGLCARVEQVPTVQYGDIVSGVQADPMGGHFAIAGNDLEIQIWSRDSSKKLQELVGHPENVKQLRYSTDGKFLLSCDESAIRVWRRDGPKFEEKPVWEFETEKSFESKISPDGRFVAAIQGDQVELLDTQTSKVVSLEGHKQAINHVCFFNNNEELISASDDGTVQRWNLSTGKSQDPIVSLSAPIHAMELSDDNESIVIATENRILIRRLSQPAIEFDLGGLSQKPNRLFSLKNGKTFGVEMEEEYSFWSFDDGKFLGRLNAPNQFTNGPIISKTGRHFATSSNESVVEIWGSDDFKLVHSIRGHTNTIYDAAFLADGGMITGSRDNTAKIWDTVESKNSMRLSLPPSADPDGDNRLFWLAVSPNSQYLAVAVQDSRVVVWDVTTGKLVENVEHHSGGVQSVSFSPDGRFLASAAQDKLIRLWDLENRKSAGEFSGHTGTVHCLDFSLDGKRLVSGGNEGQVIIWDVSEKRELHRYDSEEKPEVWAVAFSQDGRSVKFGGTDKTISNWDYDSGGLPEVMHELDANVTSLRRSSDGRMMAVTSADGKVVVFNQSDETLFQFIAHSGDAMCTSFSPDGKTLATVGSDGAAVQFWNLVAGEPTVSFFDDRKFTHCVEFAPNGSFLATARWDGTARIWKLKE